MAKGGGTGTVWDLIKPTQPEYPGTKIPKSFEIKVNTQKLWVHGNATEHIFEDVVKSIKNPSIDDNLYSQILLSDFHGSLNIATQNGVKYNEIIKVGHWDFKFAPPREPGQLPVVTHAQFNGWGRDL